MENTGRERYRFVLVSIILAVSLAGCARGTDTVEIMEEVNYVNVKKAYDDGNDGTIDRVEYFTYDADGRMKKEARDIGNDGTIDEVVYYTWERSGKVENKTEP